jgi:hypothetical protein
MARTTTPEVITAGSHESAVISGKKIRKICVFEDSNLRPQHRFLEYTNQLSYMYIWQYKFRILYCILDIPTNEKFNNCKVINHLKLKSCQLQSFKSLETNSNIKFKNFSVQKKSITAGWSHNLPIILYHCRFQNNRWW